MFTPDSLVVDVIDRGIVLLKDNGYIPQDYQCASALKARHFLVNNQPNLAMRQWCQAVANRSRMHWAFLTFNYLMFPELRAEVDRDLKLLMLRTCAQHTPLASRILALFGEQFPEDIVAKLQENASDSIVQSIKAREDYATLRSNVDWLL